MNGFFTLAPRFSRGIRAIALNGCRRAPAQLKKLGKLPGDYDSSRKHQQAER
jgi:hypothetical protein